MKLRSVRILIAPATVIAIGLWTLLAMLAWQFQWFGIGAWEMRSYNARFHVRGPVAPDPRIVLVAIDERSILGDSLDAEEIRGNPGYEWLEKFPYPRKAWATVIEKIAGAGASWTTEPPPATYAMIGAGVLGLLATRRRRA